MRAISISQTFTVNEFFIANTSRRKALFVFGTYLPHLAASRKTWTGFAQKVQF